MKTAVSIPDVLFHEAERQAATNKMSRSQLYATALAAYLREERGRQITEQMNRALEEIDQTADPVWHAAQVAAMKRSNGNKPLPDLVGRFRGTCWIRPRISKASLSGATESNKRDADRDGYRGAADFKYEVGECTWKRLDTGWNGRFGRGFGCERILAYEY